MYGGHQPSYLDWAKDHYFGALSGFYVTTADAWRRGEPYRDLMYPPGYVVFLADAGSIAGADPSSLRSVQAVFDSSAVAAVYVIAGAVGLVGAWPFLVALAYAVLPLWAAGSTFLLAESLTVPMLLWAVVLLVGVMRTRSSMLTAIAGIWIGLCTMVRPEFVVFILPAALLLLTMDVDVHVRRLSTLGIACAIVIFAWGIHNRRVHGAWIFTSASGGAGLWEGLGEVDNPFGYITDDSAASRLIASRGGQWGMPSGNAVLVHEYVNAWRDHPAFVARTVVVRLSRILFQSDRLQPLFFGRIRDLLDAFGLVALAIGVWLVRRDWSRVGLLLLLPVYAFCSVGLVHYEPRYVRYVPIAFVLGAAVTGSALMAVASTRSKSATRVVAVLLCLAGGVYVVRELAAIAASARSGIVQP